MKQGVEIASETEQALNSATAEECAASAQELSMEADLLKKNISNFKLRNSIKR